MKSNTKNLLNTTPEDWKLGYFSYVASKSFIVRKMNPIVFDRGQKLCEVTEVKTMKTLEIAYNKIF